MPQDKSWAEFEILIEQIQKEIAPDGIVKRNHKVKGLSGRRRQLDVTLTQTIGIHNIFVVLECKHYKRAVGIKAVDGFVTVIRDVKASLEPVKDL
jgi:hypothetical protein